MIRPPEIPPIFCPVGIPHAPLNPSGLPFRNRIIRDRLLSTEELEQEIGSLLEELEVVAELTRRFINESASGFSDQQDYENKYNGYVERYETAKAKLTTREDQNAARLSRADALAAFMDRLAEENESPMEFDDKLFLTVIENITVRHDGTLTFRFVNGTEVTRTI